MSIIRFFAPDDRNLHITEFGYSMPETPRKVGPWVRDTYILHVVVQGQCRFSEFIANAGDAFLIAKDRLHAFQVSPPYEHYWFAFDGEDVPRILATLNISLHKHQHFKISHAALASTVLKAAFDVAQDNERAAKSALAAILPLLETRRDIKEERRDSRIQAVADFLDAHYASHITMNQAADAVHLSEKYVCKKFKERFGLPPQQYLLRTRMERAKLLLKTTDLQIGEIAASVGYVSPLVFSSAFKQYMSVSPTVFRKNI